jgi:plasmid stability protein
MAAIVIRNLPDDVHADLRRIARERHQSVEAVAREALTTLTGRGRGGIDFEQLAQDRRVLGMTEDGPDWTEELDDPALSRKVLGL